MLQIAVGVAIAVTHRALAIRCGLALLGVIGAMLIAYPISDGQACGCAGAIDLPFEPGVRVGILAALHIAALALGSAKHDRHPAGAVTAPAS